MKLSTFAAISAAVAVVVAAPAVGADEREPTKGEVRLAKMLEGRVAGEPQNCIRSFPTLDLTVIDGTALVYKSGRTLYVNIPSDPRDVDDRDILVTRTSTSSLCSSDIMTKMDRMGGFYSGNIFLGKFVPYRKDG